MIKDRRSGNERRESDRLAVKIDVQWEGASGKRKPGNLSDLSPQGCFVLCSGEVEDGEKVRIFLPLADKMKVEFWGKIVNHIYEIGFAVRFVQLSSAQKDFIEKLLRHFAKFK